MLRPSMASTPLRLGLFIITTAPLVDALFGLGDTCKIEASAEQWKPRVAYEAAFAGKPKISIPHVGSGFNRTVNIDGFCNDVLMNSSAFTCNEDADLRGEFHAHVTDMEKAPTSAKITFDYVNCPLRGVSIRRTKAGALFEAEIRFEFEFCKALAGHPESPVTSAAVVFGLRKAPGQESNLLPWMQEVCKVGTTTPATASLIVKYEYPVVNVGQGKCKHADASDEQMMAGVETEEACKAECRSSIQVAEATKQTDGVCAGFAFSAAADADKKCIMYTTPVSELGTPDATWSCYNMSLSDKDYDKTTPMPSSPRQPSENLHLREVMAGAHATMTTAKMVQIQPQTGDEYCFPAAWWFAVQDDLGNPASIPVMEAEWAAMMDMVPPLKPEHEGVKSTMIIDRVLLKTCNPNMAGWGRSCDMPVTVPLCDKAQMANAIVTGLLVPILGWLVVQCFHKRCGWGRPDANDSTNFPICTFGNIFGLSFVAIITCALAAAGLSYGLSQAFGAYGCAHGQREIVVVAVATFVPAALTMVIGILYMHHSRETPRQEQSSGHVTSGHKLMLVEVPEGADISQARPINPDVLQTGNSAMTSYKAMGGASRIDVHGQGDMTSQFLSGFQSAPPGGSAMGSAFQATTGR